MSPLLDDSVASIVREKHANNLSKIESGEEGYKELFVFACPKFVNPAVPDYEEVLKPEAPAMPYGLDAYKLQVHHFINEMAAHQTLRKGGIGMGEKNLSNNSCRSFGSDPFGF